jgi:hypothetical protein
VKTLLGCLLIAAAPLTPLSAYLLYVLYLPLFSSDLGSGVLIYTAMFGAIALLTAGVLLLPSQPEDENE